MLPFRPHWCLHTRNTTSTKPELKLPPRGSKQQQICILCKIKSVFNEQLLKYSSCSCHFSAPLDRSVGPNTLAVVAQHHYQRPAALAPFSRWLMDFLRLKRPRSHIQERWWMRQSSEVCTSPQRPHVHILHCNLTCHHICMYPYLHWFQLNLALSKIRFC